ncbi:MAG: hypothetical protein GQ542_04205 [Desulforhopalus sp.]|nr:hypothetical protein [Desulforhopalus sp.]
MSYDINNCKFSGAVINFRKIQTKTGTPMVVFQLQCYRERVDIIAFKDLATQTT